jgi:3-oxoacyl-[acyl-carrier-protein] synthase-3
MVSTLVWWVEEVVMGTISLARAAVFLPEGTETAATIAAASGVPEAVVATKLGIVKKRRAPADLHPSEMAVSAARACLQDVDPDSVDVIVWTGSEYKDHIVWTAAIHVQRQLGCRRAFAFDLSARCSTGILGLKLAVDLLKANPSYRRILLCGGHRTGDLVDYRDPATRFLYNLADGGSAMLVERSDDGGAGNPLLDAKIITDGDFSTDVLLPAGGTRLTTRDAAAPATTFLRVPDPEGMKDRLDRVSMRNFLDVIRGAAGGRPIGYLALLHMKKSAHDGIVDALGLAPERAIYLDHYGHFGSPDQVLSLGLAEQRGLLRPGDIVVFASAGLGYMWAAQSFEWNTPTFAPAARAALA